MPPQMPLELQQGAMGKTIFQFCQVELEQNNNLRNLQEGLLMQILLLGLVRQHNLQDQILVFNLSKKVVLL